MNTFFHTFATNYTLKSQEGKGLSFITSSQLSPINHDQFRESNGSLSCCIKSELIQQISTLFQIAPCVNFL